MATYFPIFISPLSNNFPPDTPGLGCHFPLTSDPSPTLIAQHPPSPLKPGQTPPFQDHQVSPAKLSQSLLMTGVLMGRKGEIRRQEEQFHPVYCYC